MKTRKDMYPWRSDIQLELSKRPWNGMGCLFNLSGTYYNLNDWRGRNYNSLNRMTNMHSVWRSIENDIFKSFKRFGIDNNLFTNNK